MVPNNANPKHSNHGRLPPLVEQVQDSCAEQLQRLLTEFFSRCDDSLFEFAESATSNNDQNLYFEAMRELRLRKTEVSEKYFVAFKRGFAELAGARNSKPKKQGLSPNHGAGELELVKNDELEESVTIKSIVNRARMNHAGALLQLIARFEHIFSGKKIEDDANPLDPENLLNLFSECTRSLDLELRLKVFLYKRFDQVVMAELGGIYHKANELLIVAGVLPKLKLRAKSAANDSLTTTQSRQQVSGSNSATTDNSNADNEFNELRQLLTDISSGIAALPGAIDFGQFAGTAAMSSNVLLNELLQTDALVPANEDLNAKADDAAQNLIPVLINNLLQQRQQAGEASALRSADEHTINLVSLFFDFVLDAENLPIDMQALLARLQIPVLKIALRDQYLFTTKDHPLRTLINHMAQSSYGRDIAREEDEPYFALTTQLAQELINDPELNESDFIDLIADLQEFLENEDQKSQALEQRVSQSARNRALAKHAREKLTIILNDKFKHLNSPTSVHEFIYKDWHNVMLSCYLNDGEDSAAWREVEQLVDDLLWSAQWHSDQRSRDRLQRLRAGLYQTIEKRMSTHRAQESLWPERLRSIKVLHEVILAKDEAGYELLLPHDTPAVTEESMDWADTPALPNPEFKYLQRIKKLTPGDWIRLSLPGSDAEKYCKVSAYIDTDQSFLLVNRFGARVAILDCRSLAQSLQDGNLKVVEDTPIFDQAVANISAKLRGLSQG